MRKFLLGLLMVVVPIVGLGYLGFLLFRKISKEIKDRKEEKEFYSIKNDPPRESPDYVPYPHKLGGTRYEKHETGTSFFRGSDYAYEILLEKNKERIQNATKLRAN